MSIRSIRMLVSTGIQLFEFLLHGGAFAVLADGGLGVWLVAMLCLEIVPGSDAARLEIIHEIPERRPQHVVGEAREPSDVDAQLQVLVERKVARQLALH